MIEIRRWDNGSVIHSGDFKDVKECLENGVELGIDFSFANLSYAELNDAKLNDAKLNGAQLNGAELNGAELPEKSWSLPAGEEYYLFISSQVVQAGCKSYTPERWRAFNNEDIAEMDGKRALKFYPRLIELLDFYLPEVATENA